MTTPRHHLRPTTPRWTHTALRVSDIDATTQKNAAISEESAAAASVLAQRAADLQDLIGFFQSAETPRMQPASQRSQTRAPIGSSQTPGRSDLRMDRDRPIPARAPLQSEAPNPPRKIAVNETPLQKMDDDSWEEF